MAARRRLAARRHEARSRRIGLDLPGRGCGRVHHRRAQRLAAAARRRAEAPVHRLARLLSRAVRSTPGCCSSRAGSARSCTIDSFWSALGVALAAAAVGVVLSVLFGTNDDDIYSLRVVAADRAALGRAGHDRPSRDRLPRDRRPRAAGAAAGDAGRARADAWRAGSRTARTGSPSGRPDLSSQTGASQAGHPARVERRHRRLPLGREGAAGPRRLLVARGLRRARAAARQRARASSRTAVRAAATSSRAAPTT